MRSPSIVVSGSIFLKGLFDKIVRASDFEVTAQGSFLHHKGMLSSFCLDLVSHPAPQPSHGVWSLVIVHFLRGGMTCIF